MLVYTEFHVESGGKFSISQKKSPDKLKNISFFNPSLLKLFPKMVIAGASRIKGWKV